MQSKILLIFLLPWCPNKRHSNNDVSILCQIFCFIQIESTFNVLYYEDIMLLFLGQHVQELTGIGKIGGSFCQGKLIASGKEFWFSRIRHIITIPVNYCDILYLVSYPIYLSHQVPSSLTYSTLLQKFYPPSLMSLEFLSLSLSLFFLTSLLGYYH